MVEPEVQHKKYLSTRDFLFIKEASELAGPYRTGTAAFSSPIVRYYAITPPNIPMAVIRSPAERTTTRAKKFTSTVKNTFISKITIKRNH
jgi:hypothetical protein